jgi:hypothetical protein
MENVIMNGKRNNNRINFKSNLLRKSRKEIVMERRNQRGLKKHFRLYRKNQSLKTLSPIPQLRSPFPILIM